MCVHMHTHTHTAEINWLGGPRRKQCPNGVWRAGTCRGKEVPGLQRSARQEEGRELPIHGCSPLTSMTLHELTATESWVWWAE